jgi:hypothetical protein
VSLEPQETDLLVKFEIDNFPAEYRAYYAMKRNNLFARIQGFRALWQTAFPSWLSSLNNSTTLRREG